MSKRLFTVFSLLMIISMVLTACQPTPAPTQAPAATEAPAAEATEAPAAEATEAPAAEATEAPAATGGEPLKIAILAPLSGSVPTFGVSTRDGALLAIKEWNDKGRRAGPQDRGHC